MALPLPWGTPVLTEYLTTAPLIDNSGVPDDHKLLNGDRPKRRASASGKIARRATENPCLGIKKSDLWVRSDLLQEHRMRRGPGREDRDFRADVIREPDREYRTAR